MGYWPLEIEKKWTWFPDNFSYKINPVKVKLVDSKPMMSSSAYCFGVMICQILAKLWAFELIPILKHSITLYTIYLKKHIE